MDNNKQKLMVKALIGFMILIIVVGGGYLGYKHFIKKDGTSTTQKQLYTCPMHPQIVSDHPGQCPICGMDLVLKTGTDEETESNHNQNLSGSDLNAVKLSPREQILANVQTQVVKTKQFTGAMDFNGYIKINEKNTAHISTPVMGKITKMYVNFEGQNVSVGQPVFELYSPDLVSTQKEFILALENYDRIVKSGNELATQQAQSLVDASRYRLIQWEMTPAQLDEIAKTRTIKQTITVYSRYSGVVTKKYVDAGVWPMTGEVIYDVANLSTVWVIANIYESDMQYIKVGQNVEISSSSYPNEPFNAKINFVDPVFDPASRTLEVRIDVANRNYKLKPDMYVKIKINTYHGQNLAVPTNAVIRTGDKDIVYVEKEKGVYEPRRVKIGYEQDGYYEILSGLKEGEVIVSSGGFLIDSESQIEFGTNSGQNDSSMNMSSSDEKFKINPEQDIMKDMSKKNNQYQH
jgi:Cu(I)/Ag(I) efflux system membrane fusion protein